MFGSPAYREQVQQVLNVMADLNDEKKVIAEYTSGHSTFSASAADILKRFTGSDAYGESVRIPAGWSEFEPNVPARPMTLSWATFSEAADQAGVSRIYGGIHFRAGDLEARDCGRLVAGRVWEVCQSYINGAAAAPRA